MATRDWLNSTYQQTISFCVRCDVVRQIHERPLDKAMVPAVADAGFKPVRIDREEHANRIDDEIIARINGSRFMVADFTGQRPGVYFEAGLMRGLGRTLIWMCAKKDLGSVHFDTRQYNFIDYETLPEARDRLFYRILALEGQGPEPTSSR